MQKLSAVIITFNEEKNIARCLQSLQGVADEIIVVDSGSTDKTEEICQSFNVRFIRQEWLGYIEQKNYAMSLAKYLYILSLDADEALSDELKKSILAVKENKTVDGYKFNRLNNYCGEKWIRHGSWYPDTKLRLWNKKKGRWSGINPHDCVKMENDTQVKHLKGDLLHYSYSSISEHIAQANKHTDIMAQEYYMKAKSVSILTVICKSIWKFFRDYFIKLGILDGYYGLVICLITAFTTFIKYVKLRQLYQKK
ncbi:glycosyl transferase [Bacteroidia bacterium]|nr:glycosyl transferase [Bacteroidia bacterium]